MYKPRPADTYSEEEKRQWRESPLRRMAESFGFEPSMDIFALPETKVIFTGKGGGEFDQQYHRKYLEVGHEYTVAYTEVGGSHSYVYLKEFLGKPFNTLCFKES